MAENIVTRHLLSRLSRQIETERVVVWYDPEQTYTAIFAELKKSPTGLPSGTKLFSYDGSFFALRHALEPFLSLAEPPRLLIYVPLLQEQTENALIEAEILGVVLKPGQQPVARNTRLAVVAREALAPVLGEEAARKVSEDTAQGKLTLAELDRLAERSEGLRGVLSTLYDGITEAEPLALAFLTQPGKDAELLQREALPEAASLLQELTGFVGDKASGPVAMRQRFVRYLLVSDLAAHLLDGLPAAMDSMALAPLGRERDTCVQLVNTLRQRRDLAESYVSFADAVAKEINVVGLLSNLNPMAHAETFRELESLLLQRTERQLLEAGDSALGFTVAKERQRSFWSGIDPALRARWALIEAASRVLLEAERTSAALKELGSAASPAALIELYAGGEAPACLLDTAHRHLERRWHSFDFMGETDLLEKLVVRARQKHSEVASELAERFARGWHKARFQPDASGLSGVQRGVFAHHVAPLLSQGGTKVAYFLVDALRFEMARELADTLRRESHPDTQIQAVLGTVPTITEIGMAALLPGADDPAVALVPGAAGKVALEIGGKALRGRPERVQHLQAWLKAHYQLEMADVKLEDLLPKPSPRRHKALREAGFLFVTSQEIDSLAESGNVPLARRTMDEMLREIRRAFRVLTDLGVTHIVCVADHGHLFLADDLQDDMKVEAPGGETVDLHRRVWIGRGGASDPAVLRAKAADFGLGGTLELAFPSNLACFKAIGTAMAYFHGGISPQELVIPVLTVAIQRTTTMRADWIWSLQLSSKRITTRFFSVTIEGTTTSLFESVPPRVRLELRLDGKCIGQPITAAYGFDETTSDVVLQKQEDSATAGIVRIQANTVTLQLTEAPATATASLHLLEADTGIELQHLGTIPVEITL